MYTVIVGDFSWSEINVLAEDAWFTDETDALLAADAEAVGEPVICADGLVQITPVQVGGEAGYLVEDRRHA